MTEDKWLHCVKPMDMLQFLRGRASDRKFRLLAVACGRKHCHLIIPDVRRALDIAELVAEGIAGRADRRRAREMAFHADWISDSSTAHRRGPAKAVVCDALARRGWEAARNALWRTIRICTLEARRSAEEWSDAEACAEVLLTGLVREIFGNPFRPVAIDPAWRAWNDGTVVKLAEAIYDDRELPSGHLDPGRLAILADALEDAGCTNADILGHCRSPGPHVRGCWVVDLLLGRE